VHRSKFQSINIQIEAVAELHPDKTAINIDDETITYSELVKRINRFSNYLLSYQIPVQSNILVYMDRSIDCVVAMLAVMNVGCVYVPLDPVHSATRVEYILEDAVPFMVITQSSLIESIKTDGDTLVIDLEAEASSEKIKLFSDLNPFVQLYPEYVMYMLYTSGTTGNPKGVIVHYRGVMNLLESVMKHWPLEKNVLQFASLGFDASIPEWAGCLCKGGTLIMIKNRSLVLGNELLNVLEKYKVSIIKMPSAVLSTLDHIKDLPHLSTVVTAGDACTVDLVDKWANGRSFYNCYGPTEASIGSTMALCTQGQEKVNIGRPHPGIEIYILTERMDRVKPFETGEIYIGGKGVSYGYYRKASLTAEKFLPNPFSSTGEVIYKTGDLGYFSENDEMHFAGRIDSQIKIRGFRVELEEINSAVKKHPFINDAATIVISEEGTFESTLTGFFTSEGDESVSAADLKNYLKDYIPEYMIPTEFFQISNFALTPNGKKNLEYLTDYYHELKKQQYESVQNILVTDGSTVENKLTEIWKLTLKVAVIDDKSNFFELGGTSLDAANVIAKIETELGVAPSIADLYETPDFLNFRILSEIFVKAFSN